MALSDATCFEPSLTPLVSPAMADLGGRLFRIYGLEAAERDAIVAAARQGLHNSLHRRLCRLLLLELNAALVEWRLGGVTSEARWDDFLRQSADPAFWRGLVAEYPTLTARIDRLIANAVQSAEAFARHWAGDREALSRLLDGRAAGRLVTVEFGAGDSHRGGRTVAMVSCDGGRLVYKPRSLASEVRLGAFLSALGSDLGRPLAAEVPAVAAFHDHGWSAFAPHAYAEGPAELHSFYQGVGQWLAIMRLLGGTDLHAENLIANRGAPVVVDSETLFTPKVAPFASALGEAYDRSNRLVSGTVLAIGLLPLRGQALGLRGVDMSGLGALPGQQPVVTVPDIIDAGTDRARMGARRVTFAIAQNHPGPEPRLAQFWPDVLKGFDEVSHLLRRLDHRGRLRDRLAPFEAIPIRVPVRPTEVYAELARMLWHPVSLHDEAAAKRRAHDLLARMAANVSLAPSDPVVIDAEIEDLMAGDVPFFVATARDGRLEGPSQTRWLGPRNLVEDALADWRAADLTIERTYVRNALVCAYVGDEPTGGTPSTLVAKAIRSENQDLRRRRLAAGIMQQFVEMAIAGRDGTVTWIATTQTEFGWSVQPLGPDLYGGLSGVAVLVAAYLRETEAGRADAVEGLERLLARLQTSLARFEAKQMEDCLRGSAARPPAPGGYIGLGSQIWRLLLLRDWGLGQADALEQAMALARCVPAAAATDEAHDLLSGTAGAIRPLLELARRMGDAGVLAITRDLGDRLVDRAVWQDGRAFWRGPHWPEGLGGFAHGVSGIGWALTQLARVCGDVRHQAAADAAFAFEDAHWDEAESGWTDLRKIPGQKTVCSWCNGATGIGLARLDLDPRLEQAGTRLAVRRAVAATWKRGFGRNHCACHGDLGSWELMDRAIAPGEAPPGVSREGLLASLLTSLEDNGPVCGPTDAFLPSLLQGHGSLVYQLLRAHPACDLPSMLTPSLAATGDQAGALEGQARGLVHT